MPYFSKFYQMEIRDSIVREFTDSQGRVDDMMAGLHEIRARLLEERYPGLIKKVEGLKKPKASRK